MSYQHKYQSQRMYSTLGLVGSLEPVHTELMCLWIGHTGSSIPYGKHIPQCHQMLSGWTVLSQNWEQQEESHSPMLAKQANTYCLAFAYLLTVLT